MFNWSKHTKHALPFSCSNTTQLKTKARKVLIDRVKARKTREACRRVLMMGKARRRADTLARKAHKARINDG